MGPTSQGAQTKPKTVITAVSCTYYLLSTGLYAFHMRAFHPHGFPIVEMSKLRSQAPSTALPDSGAVALTAETTRVLMNCVHLPAFRGSLTTGEGQVGT